MTSPDAGAPLREITVRARSLTASPFGLVYLSGGDAFLAGRFGGTLAFGPDTLVNTSREDVFVARLSPAATPWGVQFEDTSTVGGILVEGSHGLAANVDAGVVVIGEFADSVDFGDGPRSTNGFDDIFVVSLDPNGSFRWVNTFGSSRADLAGNVTVTATGQTFVSGAFPATITVGPVVATPSGGSDIFLASIDRTGVVTSARALGGSGDELTRSLDAKEGLLFGCGDFTGVTDLGTGAIPSAGGRDIFVAHYDLVMGSPNAAGFGGTGDDLAFDLAVAGGQVLVVGQLSTTVDFGAAGSVDVVGGRDAFVAALSGDLVPLWVRSWGSSANDRASTISIDGAGLIYVAGEFQDSVDFGGGPRASMGGSDVFIVVLDADGGYVADLTFGSTASDGARALSAAASGQVSLAGTVGSDAVIGGTPIGATGVTTGFVVSFD